MSGHTASRTGVRRLARNRERGGEGGCDFVVVYGCSTFFSIIFSSVKMILFSSSMTVPEGNPLEVQHFM